MTVLTRNLKMVMIMGDIIRIYMYNYDDACRVGLILKDSNKDNTMKLPSSLEWYVEKTPIEIYTDIKTYMIIIAT